MNVALDDATGAWEGHTHTQVIHVDCLCYRVIQFITLPNGLILHICSSFSQQVMSAREQRMGGGIGEGEEGRRRERGGDKGMEVRGRERERERERESGKSSTV